MTAALTALYLTVTATFGLPPGLLSAVCFVESGHNARAYHLDDGGSPSLGECQLKAATAREMGFRGTQAQLLAPSTNVYFAGAYLRRQLARYNGNVRQAVAAYNAGSFRPKARGKPDEALNHRYVSKVLRAWKEQQ